MAEFDVMTFYNENQLLIFTAYALVIGYFIGKNRNRFREKIHHLGNYIDDALSSLSHWFEKQKVNKNLAKKHEYWSLINFYFVLFAITSPLYDLPDGEFNVLIWLPITLLAFMVAIIFLFYELQFMKEAFGTEIVEEKAVGEVNG